MSGVHVLALVLLCCVLFPASFLTVGPKQVYIILKRRRPIRMPRDIIATILIKNIILKNNKKPSVPSHSQTRSN